MRSDTPGDPDSYVLVTPLEAETSRNDSVYTCELPDLDTKNEARAYSIQLEIGDGIFSTEPFQFSDDENNYVLIREIKRKTKGGVTIWIVLAISIVALVIALLVLILRFVC